jgi:hypothetical protein
LFVLVIDYDSIFMPGDVAELYRIIDNDATIDAVCAVQVGRDRDAPLMCHTDSTGTFQVPIGRQAIEGETIRLKTAHFGLTVLRTSSFAAVEKPWFMPIPDTNNSWGDGRQDDDIAFWDRWWKAGNTLYQANHVPIGHCQMMVSWPDRDLKPIHQYDTDWRAFGKPEGTLNFTKEDT